MTSHGQDEPQEVFSEILLCLCLFLLYIRVDCRAGFEEGMERRRWEDNINPLNAELNPIRHLLALVGARHIVHVSRIRVKVHVF